VNGKNFGDSSVNESSSASPTKENTGAALKYADHKQIADWAIDSVGTMTKKGYVSGRPGNLFAPKDNLSRSEAVKMIDNVMGELINSNGTYTKTVPGNMVVSSHSVTLKDINIDGDLYLTDGIGQDTIRLIGVTVKGRTIISGTLSGKVIVLNGDFGEIVIESPGAVVTVESGAVGRFVVGKTAAGAIITAKDGTLIEELITYAGADITGGGNIKNVVIASGGVTMDERPQNVIIADGGKAVSYKPGSDDTGAPGGGGSGGGDPGGGGDSDDGDPDGGDSGGGPSGGGDSGGGDPDDGDPDDGDPDDDPEPDTTAPSVPIGLTGTAVSSSVVSLSWTASTDNVGVTGYHIYRDDTEIGTSTTTSYTDTGLAADTTYSYAVAAYDEAGNLSDWCSVIEATTLSETGNVYYVDYGSGSDDNDGLSPETAWKHAPIDLEADGCSLKAEILPGDTILFRSDVVYRGKLVAGSYYGKRNLGMGTEGNPITLKGDGWGEGKAIIDGSEPLSGWERCKSSAECGGNENWENIWVTTVPSEWITGTNRALTLNPYQGEQMMSIAQYPDQPNTFYFDDTTYFATADILTETYLEEDALAGIDLTGSYLALWGGNNNVLIRKPTSIDTSTNRVTYDEIINPYGSYSILNSIDTNVLNRQGEVYFDEPNGKLYIWPFDGADPNKEEITISVRSDGVEFWSGNDYAAIEGFIVQKYIGSGICWSQSPIVNGCVIRNNVVRYCRRVDGPDSIHVKNMMNSLVEGNEIYNNAGPIRGITCLGGSGHIVRNNTIRESGRTGIYFNSVKDGMILNNTVIDNKGKHSNGISVYGDSRDILVAGNMVCNSNIAYTMQEGTDVYLFNNILMGSHGSNGISVWSGMNGMHLYNNLINSWYLGDKSINVNTANNIIIATGPSTETESMDLYLSAKPATDMSTLFRNSPVISGSLADVHKYESLTNVSTVYLADNGYESTIKPGYFLRYDQSTVHQITEVTRVVHKGNWRTQLVLDTPIDTVRENAYVEVWKSKDDFIIDYHLFDGSIAVDRGTDISGLIPVEKFPLYDFSKDFDRVPRDGMWDIGPYEYDGN
jgi:parallel beta-helix repeat protein